METGPTQQQNRLIDDTEHRNGKSQSPKRVASLDIFRDLLMFPYTHSSSMASLSSSPVASALHPTPLNTNKFGAPDRPSPFHPSVWGDYFLSYSEDHKVNTNHMQLMPFKLQNHMQLIHHSPWDISIPPQNMIERGVLSRPHKEALPSIDLHKSITFLIYLP
ncbi:hypothetical protein CKAN_00496900 [Cinnamomum micranthum f. kanehirae]|uniref:Uncharacterized protein n=1 Tax=Cinnamomum micranthum f. kanehirae TaxID=337451 RepID=A0A3S3MHG9_9MAGN|nr:hypothetical protein CKAN_00496900 [Cinnamomum micranthum f. kanehirae]